MPRRRFCSLPVAFLRTATPPRIRGHRKVARRENSAGVSGATIRGKLLGGDPIQSCIRCEDSAAGPCEAFLPLLFAACISRKRYIGGVVLQVTIQRLYTPAADAAFTAAKPCMHIYGSPPVRPLAKGYYFATSYSGLAVIERVCDPYCVRRVASH